MPTPIEPENDFDVPLVMTAEWMQKHIDGLRKIEADASIAFEEYLAKNPNPKGEAYQQAWMLRQRREGARSLIDIHSIRLRALVEEEAK